MVPRWLTNYWVFSTHFILHFASGRRGVTSEIIVNEGSEGADDVKMFLSFMISSH